MNLLLRGVDLIDMTSYASGVHAGRKMLVGHREIEHRARNGRMQYRQEPIYIHIYPPDVNNNMKYIFVAVDCFSRKVCVVPIGNRGNDDPTHDTLLSYGLYQIMVRADTTHHIIQGDG